MIIFAYVIYQYCLLTYHHIPVTHLPTIWQAVLTLLPTTTDNSPSSATEIVCWFGCILYLWNEFMLERESSSSKKQYIGHVQRINLWLDTMQFDHQQGNGSGFLRSLVVSLISKQMSPDEGVKASFRRGGNIALVFQFEPRGLIDRPAGALARTRPAKKLSPFTETQP